MIALSGGSPSEREAIAQRLVESGKARLISFSQREPKAGYPAQRARILVTAMRRRNRSQGVVITHCLTEREAEEVRELGGAVWHLYSRPSALVVIRNGDPVVVNGEDGFAHVRSPLEALSELMLARAG